MDIKEIIVVEGKSDTVAVKRAVNADTIETNGSAISGETLGRIRHAQEKRGVIVFTDPDYPGRRIRAIIEQHVSGVKHAFLPKEKTISENGKKLGIEHASDEDIRYALSNVYTPDVAEKTEAVPMQILIETGLVGHKDSKKRRERIGTLLNIGYTNGKQLQKRLSMFQIGLSQLLDAVALLDEEEDHD